ncbi:MAG TPA: hypothetical protein VMF91_15675 [Bryobacteraceae bacterium]|nr:hypothetical protein [Bryobacteraceae bacterium]
MTIQLRPEREQVIWQAIEAGLIQGAEEVVEVGVETICRRLEACSRKVSAADCERWSNELHAWVSGHSHNTPLLSDEAISRDSIFETRGQ